MPQRPEIGPIKLRDNLYGFWYPEGLHATGFKPYGSVYVWNWGPWHDSMELARVGEFFYEDPIRSDIPSSYKLAAHIGSGYYECAKTRAAEKGGHDAFLRWYSGRS